MPTDSNDRPFKVGWKRFVLAGLAIFLILGGCAYHFAATSALMEPVRIHVVGLSDDGAKRFQLLVAQERGSAQGKVAERWQWTSYWYLHGLRIQEMIVKLPQAELPNLLELTVTIGAESSRFSGDDVRRWERPGGSSAGTALADVWLIAPIPARPSAVPGIGSANLNWPGDGVYVHAVVQAALVPIMLVGLIAYWWGRRERVAATPQEAEPSRAAVWNWLTVVVLAGSLVLLEARDPYYFTQCDTLNECFPMILVGCRYVWQGEFPDYNPYLYLGSPLASLGMYSLTYPPLYLSYALALHVLGDEYATIEVFAIVHLVAGFFLTRLLGRKLGMSAGPANLVALSCVLSGASLIMGRAWFNFIPLVVGLPLLFLGLLRLERGPVSWAWLLGMGLALGLPFHVGFSQAAVYLIGFFSLAVLYLIGTGGLPWRRALMLGPALLLGAAIAMPLIYPQWLLARDVRRARVPDEGIAMGLPAMLLPYPLVEAQIPTNWGNENLQFMGHFYFFGGLFAFLFCYHAVGLVVRRVSVGRPSRTVHTDGRGSPSHELWTFCGLMALWLSLGNTLGLWTFVSWLPVFGKINRHPLRVMPFVVFFMSIVGGLVLERMLRRAGRRPRTEMIVMICALLVLVMHADNCRTTFHVDRYLPYPELPADLLARLRGQPIGRVTCSGRYSNNRAFALQLPQNLAAVHELPTAEGVNPLLEGNQRVIALTKNLYSHRGQASRAYGVRWHLSQTPDQWTEGGYLRNGSWMPEALVRSPARARFLAGLPVVRYPEGIEVRELVPVDPLAFTVDTPVKSSAQTDPIMVRPALDVEMHGWGLGVDVSKVAGPAWVVVNFLHYPEMQASVDDQPIPCVADPWGRMVVEVPPGAKQLTIRYAAPWATGLMIGLATAGVGLALGMMLLRQARAAHCLRSK